MVSFRLVFVWFLALAPRLLSFCFLVWSVFVCIACGCECISHKRRPWGAQSAGLRPLYHHHHCLFWGWVRTGVPYTFWHVQNRSHPPTPFLSNAVKYSPGRGWGWPRAGNRTVTLTLLVFPLSRRGNCWPFFSFCVFCLWFGVFCRFFTVLLFLGSLFEKNFGGELLFYGVGVGLVFFGAVLPMFLL